VMLQALRFEDSVRLLEGLAMPQGRGLEEERLRRLHPGKR